MQILGIDIGGTEIKADLYDEFGICLNKFKTKPTLIDYPNKTNNILNQVHELIEEYLLDTSLDGVGISCAGIINNIEGKVHFAGPTIPGFIGTEFKKTIEDKYNIKTFVENDVNAAALGEMWKGEACKFNHAFMMTIGTGIGGGIIENGEVLHGGMFSAGEVGYLPLHGQRFEDVASTSAFIKKYEEKTGLKNQNGKTFFQAKDEKNEIAIQVYEEFISDIAQGLTLVLYLLNPEVVIIGGGILARKEIVNDIENKLKEKIFDHKFMPKKILAASLGNEAGRIGAVKYFLNEYAKEEKCQK